MSTNANHVDWRGILITPGATVIYATGEGNAPGQGEVIEVDDGHVTMKVIYRSGYGTGRAKTKVQRGKVTVIETLPPAAIKMTVEEKVAQHKAWEKVREANYATHNFPAEPEAPTMPRTTYNNYGYNNRSQDPAWIQYQAAQETYRDVYAAWLARGCLACGVDPGNWTGSDATKDPCAGKSSVVTSSS